MSRFQPHVTHTGAVLHLPPAHVIHKTKPKQVCTVIVNGDGELCGHPSYTIREALSHSSSCAKRHESAIRAYRNRTHPEMMRAWDPELEAWFSKHKRAVLEGRMKA